jgi:hypothetical protein
VPLQTAQDRFPLWHMRQIDNFTSMFFELTGLISRVMWKEVFPKYEGPEADQQALKTYRDQ